MADSSLPSAISRAEAKAKGLKHYFTGKPCSRGHIQKRNTVTGQCMECSRLKAAERRAKNPEKCREINRASYARNIEESRAYFRQKMSIRRATNPNGVNAYKRNLYAANPGTVLRRNKQYRVANKEKIAAQKKIAYFSKRDTHRAARKAYYRANAERFRLLYRADYDANPDKFKARAAARRARKLGAKGRYTREDVRRLYFQQGGKCANLACWKSIRRKYHIDHIIPLILGGSNWPNNLQLLCPGCNQAKSAKPPEEWEKENGTLF